MICLRIELSSSFLIVLLQKTEPFHFVEKFLGSKVCKSNHKNYWSNYWNAQVFCKIRRFVIFILSVKRVLSLQIKFLMFFSISFHYLEFASWIIYTFNHSFLYFWVRELICFPRTTQNLNHFQIVCKLFSSIFILKLRSLVFQNLFS